MGVKVTLKDIDKYMDIMGWEKTGDYVMARIGPSGELALNILGVTPLLVKNYVLVFTNGMMAAIEVDLQGKFVARHTSFKLDDIIKMEYKEGANGGKLLVETSDVSYKFRVFKTLPEIPWQEAQLRKLIAKNWCWDRTVLKLTAPGSQQVQPMPKLLNPAARSIGKGLK